MKKFLITLTAMILITPGCFTKSENTLKHAEALRRLGEAYLNQEEYTLSIQKLKESERINPKDHVTHDDLGLAYMARKEYGKSIEHFNMAVEIKPDYAPALNNLGTAYMNAGKWDEAIASFEKINDNLVYSTPHYPLANLGWAYYNKKMYAKSKDYYLKALSYSPNFVKAMRGLAQTYSAMGKTDMAVETLEKAIGLAPTIAELHYEIGEIYYKTGRNDEAAISFQKAVELGKGRPVVSMAKKRLEQM